MKKYKITFNYKGDSTVEKVSIAGTFNGWDHTKNYFSKSNSGDFYIEMNIPVGRHFYKFVINDTDWILDPNNSNISEDGQNNSSITITEDGKKLIRSKEINKNNPDNLFLKYEALKTPQWLHNGVIYQLSIKSFSKDGIAGVKNKLEYLKELGVSVLWIMPFWKIGQKNRQGTNGDPYAVYDFYTVDENIGDEYDIHDLVDMAHKHGMKVLFDMPINRVAIDSILVNEHKEYFTINSSGEVYYNVPGRTSFAGFNFESRELFMYIIDVMRYWIKKCNFDGVRFDDSDITPLDFLIDIRKELNEINEEFVIISQAYDEYHHISFCNLTYDGFLRQAIRDISEGNMTKEEFINYYESFKYSFPKGALRMRWLEEKETIRAFRYYKPEVLHSAIALLFTFDGVPALIMGQEYNETTYNTYKSLFNDYIMNWKDFDIDIFNIYKKWIGIRKQYEALWNGEIEFVDNPFDKVISFIRSTESQKVLILVNLGKVVSRFKLQDILEEEIYLESYQAKCIQIC